MESSQQNLFTYLDKALGEDGIKTTNKIDLGINTKTTLTLVGIGMGLVVFNHALRWGIETLK